MTFQHELHEFNLSPNTAGQAKVKRPSQPAPAALNPVEQPTLPLLGASHAAETHSATNDGPTGYSVQLHS